MARNTLDTCIAALQLDLKYLHNSRNRDSQYKYLGILRQKASSRLTSRAKFAPEYDGREKCIDKNMGFWKYPEHVTAETNAKHSVNKENS